MFRVKRDSDSEKKRVADERRAADPPLETSSRFKDFLNGPLSLLPFSASFLLLLHRARGGSARGDIIPSRRALSAPKNFAYPRLPLVPPFIRSPKLLENLRKRRNERASVSPSLYSLSPTSSLSVDGLSERQTARRMERIWGTRRNTARKGGKERKKRRKKRKKEGKRSAERTPFTAQWVPLKPKVMKVSGCLSRFLYRAPIHNLTTPYGTHDTYIPGVPLRTTRTMRSIQLSMTSWSWRTEGVESHSGFQMFNSRTVFANTFANGDAFHIRDRVVEQIYHRYYYLISLFVVKTLQSMLKKIEYL